MYTYKKDFAEGRGLQHLIQMFAVFLSVPYLQDTVSDALGVKISEVHRCCVDSRLTYLSTLEKLSSVEYRISLLFQFMESIPKESLETLRLIKDSDRSSRSVFTSLGLKVDPSGV